MDNPISPPPTVSVTMSFGDALKALVDGKKIARIEWNNTDYGFLKDGFVAIHKNGEDFANWLINDGDILATDWKVVA